MTALRLYDAEAHCTERGLPYAKALAEQPMYLQRNVPRQGERTRLSRYMRSDAYSYLLNDARVFGPGFAEVDGRVFARGMSHSNHPSFIQTAMEQYVKLPEGGALNDEFELLWGHHTYIPDVPCNWGHFLWTYLLRLAFHKQALPLLVRDTVPARFLDWARKLGFTEFVSVPDGTRVHGLVVSNTLAHRCDDAAQTAAVLPSAVHVLRHRLGITLSRHAHQRFYVSRKNADWRTVLNEQELIDALPADFKVITPETMTVDEQIDAIRRASTIIMPVGGGSPLTMLAPEDCTVVELGFEGIVGVFASAAWADVLGQKYVRVNGEPGAQRGVLAIDRDYTISIPAVLEQL